MVTRIMLPCLMFALAFSSDLILPDVALSDQKPKGIDLSGYWRTGSGAEYRIQYENNHVIALYWNPSPPQLASGYKRGDLAFKVILPTTNIFFSARHSSSFSRPFVKGFNQLGGG